MVYKLLPCVRVSQILILRSKFLCSSSIKIYQKILQIGMFCCWTPYWEQVRFLFLFSGRHHFLCQLNLIKISNHSSMGMSEGEYNWCIWDILHWVSWADYIGYIGLTLHVGTQCGIIPIYSNNEYHLV